MKLTFLGTGAGEGYPGRWCECPHCAYARQHGGRNVRANSSAILDDELLFDMNQATFDNAGRFAIALGRVSVALITHPHEDHLNLDNLYWRAGRDEAATLPLEQLIAMGSAPRFTPIRFLDVYGNGYTEEVFRFYPHDLAKRHMAFHRIENGETFRHQEYTVTPIRGNHVKPGFSTNYIVEKGGKTLLYACDSGGYDEDVRQLLAQHRYDLIVMEGTGGLGSGGEGHMSLERNIAWRTFFLNAGCITEATPFVLTHLSPHWTPPYDQYVDIAGQAGLTVAYDGFAIEF